MNSHSFVMKNRHWIISIYVIEKIPDYLGIFLQLEDKAEDLIVKVNFSLQLISYKDSKKNISRGPWTDVFPSTRSLGWPFIKLSDLKDVNKGYLTNGNVTVKLDATFDA